jgi:hypothetical protein
MSEDEIYWIAEAAVTFDAVIVFLHGYRGGTQVVLMPRSLTHGKTSLLAV